MIKVNDNTLFLTISVPDNANKISITNPALKNHVVVNDARITPSERAKLASVEEGATADQTLTNTDNNIVLENGPDYEISLADSITLNNDLTAVDTFVDRVLIQNTSSGVLPGSQNAALFYVDSTDSATYLKARGSGDLKLQSIGNVNIKVGNSHSLTIGDTQSFRGISNTPSSGFTVRTKSSTQGASSQSLSFDTDGVLSIGALNPYKFPVNSAGASQGEVLKLAADGETLIFGETLTDLSTSEFNDLSDVDVDYNDWNGYTQGPNILYNALVYDGTNWVMYNSVQGSFPPNTTNISFLGDAAPIDKSKIGFDGFNNGLSINSDTSYASSGINLYVNGGARVDGAIQVNDPSSTGYAFPTTDGTANQLLATNGSGAVTFVTPSTSNVTEGTNLYYTDARVAANSAVAANTAKTSFPGFGTTAGTALEGNTALFDGQYSSLTGVPSTFAPSAHTHTASEITDFDAEVSNNTSVAANTAKVGYTDAAVDSRIAAASIDDLSDVDTSTVAPTDGQALVWDNANSKWEPGTVSGGGSSPWTTSGSDIYYTTGNVGVGTTTPAEALDVVGDVKFDGKILAAKSSNDSIVIGSSTTGSGGANVSSGKNVVIGLNAMNNYQYSNGIARNIAIGDQALRNGSGGNNVAIGNAPGLSNTSRSSAVMIGSSAGRSTGGSKFVAIGLSALRASNTNNQHTVGIGTYAGAYLKGDYNTLIGGYAGTGDSGGTSTAGNTVAVGYQALTALTTGAGNTAVGYQAGDAITDSSSCTLVGYSAGSDLASGANYNTLIGAGSGAGITNGVNNVLVGRRYTGLNSSYRVSLGHDTGASSYSVIIGDSAAKNSSWSQGITAVGHQALTALTSGAYNTALGHKAGLALTTGGSNILIGDQAGSTLTTESNKLYIENSNSTTPLIYGEFDNDVVRVNGTLQVNDPSSTGYAFPTTTGTLGQVLEVDASGDLVFATPSGGSGGGLGSADQTLTGDRLIDTNGYNLEIELDPTGTADTFTIHDGTHDLFQVDTGTTGTLFSVNDVSGLPKLEVDEDEGVIAKSIKVDDSALTVAGQYGKGAEIWYQGTSTPTAGSVYYLDSSGNWANTDASAVATAKGMLSVSAGADSDVDGMVIKGFVYVGTDPGGSVGDVVYLSETANQLTTTAPTTALAVVRVCGYKAGTNIVYFDPSKDWIELS